MNNFNNSTTEDMVEAYEKITGKKILVENDTLKMRYGIIFLIIHTVECDEIKKCLADCKHETEKKNKVSFYRNDKYKYVRKNKKTVYEPKLMEEISRKYTEGVSKKRLADEYNCSMYYIEKYLSKTPDNKKKKKNTLNNTTREDSTY